jgi:hypothetical protein
MRAALAERLTAIPSIEIPEDRLEKFPTSPIAALRDLQHLDAFTEASTRQGTVVVFPSLEYHRVLPLRSGVRYSLVSWVSGPAFR